MPLDLKMPALSPTMEKGTLAKWLVAVGDTVKVGDLLAEIETDKATMEFEALDDGTISALLVAAGSENVAVGTVIAQLHEVGEKVAAAEPSLPAAAVLAPPLPPTVAQVVLAYSAAPPSEAGAPVNATPLAKRIASAQNISLTKITGTGVRGKIVKADLGLTPAPSAVTAFPAPAAITPDYPPPAGVPVCRWSPSSSPACARLLPVVSQSRSRPFPTSI